MEIREVMIKNVATVGAGALVPEASKIMSEREIGSIVVVEEGKPIGIATERDFLKRVLAKDKDPRTVKIGEVMSSPVITISPKSSVADAIALMRKKNVRRLVVVEGEKVVGIVTSKDFMEYFSYFYDRVW